MKKGFTLIELLGVIILLAVIALIAYPLINNVIKDSRDRAYQQTVNGIEEAAKIYVTNNIVDYSTGKKQLSLDKLKSAGLLTDADIKNPIDNSTLGGCVLYNWNNGKNQYEIEYDVNCDPSTDLACFDYADAVKSYDINYDSCVTYFLSLERSEETINEICSGNEVEGISLEDYLGMNLFGQDFSVSTLIYNNVITNVVYEGVAITNYKCGGTVNINFNTPTYSVTDGTEMNPIIPKQIDGKDVVEIGPSAFAAITINPNSSPNNGGIVSKNSLIRSVEMPSTIKKIKIGAFFANMITEIDFSTMTQLEQIGVASFMFNNLQSADLSKLSYLNDIGMYSFCMSNLNGNLENLGYSYYTANVTLPTGYNGNIQYSCPPE